ncbi:hypothetical protein TNCV_3181381 [Trichonephila clavipes]|nr:hypothetical protein TNCV_3181381 [Trichonephila clavipes]
MWNCPNNSVRGCRLKNFIDNHDLSIAHPDTPTSLWHCQKLFRKNRPNIPSLSTSSGVANSDDQKANILAITLKDNFAENKRPGNGSHPIDKEITKTLENFFSSPPPGIYISPKIQPISFRFQFPYKYQRYQPRSSGFPVVTR